MHSHVSPPPPPPPCYYYFFLQKKDKHFADVHTLLFDGEAALATKKARDLVMEKYHLKLYADPGAKRNMAERGIRGKKAFCFCMILPPPPPPVV